MHRVAWMVRLAIVACLAAALSGALCAQEPAAAEDSPQSPEGLEFFEKRIRPALAQHCYECHSAQSDRPEGGLLLDSASAIRQGGDSGPVVKPGDAGASPLIHAISYSGDFYDMPPTGKLPQRVIASFRTWIELGAPLPIEEGPAVVRPQQTVDVEAGRKFWSFQPLARVPLPGQLSQSDWPRKRIDHFVLAKLDQQGFVPAPEADRRTWARRVSLDLTGLPPSYEQVQNFIRDPAPDAYERYVERLLALPAYGERWARHWLDVARYAEDNPTGESTCKPPRHPHPYRDWVIRAIAEDMPYDEFVRRQLAADLMPELPPSEIAATGLLGLSPVYHKEPKLARDVIATIVADEWDERLDTITRGLLGLTVACARCHNHKFDPISSADYYALAGVMASTQPVEWPLVKTNAAAATALTDTYLAEVDTQLKLAYARTMKKTAAEKDQPTEPFEPAIADLDQQLEELKSRQLFAGPIANAVRDAGVWVNGDDPDWTSLDFRPGVPRDVPIFRRGSVTNPGEIVPRRFIEVLSSGTPQPFQHGSGRLELADAIVTDAAPLAARVIVNRVWGWHFGRGLVTTPSNFGQLGDRPSHPQLLDDLAARFGATGWSLKWLHREVVLSSTYRQASMLAPEQSSQAAEFHRRDPANEYLWRMHRRRMEAECWRDTVLAISGQLDRRMEGPSADLDHASNRRRTIYGTVSRQKPADVLRLFDFPDAKRHSDRRIPTITPLQELYVLNSRFVRDHAQAIADDVAAQSREDPQSTVRLLFERILQRHPSDEELASALAVVTSPSGEIRTEQWTTLAHGLLASSEFLFVD